jgi:hypothetical protein
MNYDLYINFTVQTEQVLKALGVVHFMIPISYNLEVSYYINSYLLVFISCYYKIVTDKVKITD